MNYVWDSDAKCWKFFCEETGAFGYVYGSQGRFTAEALGVCAGGCSRDAAVEAVIDKYTEPDRVKRARGLSLLMMAPLG